MTKQLSPAAQAVMNACTDAPIHINWATRFTAAAVLRAAADIVDDREASRQLDAIAYELEAQWNSLITDTVMIMERITPFSF